MNEYPKALAMAYGVVATLAPFLSIAFWMLTRDFAITERRVQRLSMLSGLVAATVAVVAEVELYDMNSLAGSFLVAPTIFLTGAAFWFSWRWTYRAAGGGKKASSPPELPIVVEPACHAGWARRDLAPATVLP